MSALSPYFEVVQVIKHHEYVADGGFDTVSCAANAVIVLPDGETAITWGNDNVIVKMNLRTGQPLMRKEEIHGDNGLVCRICLVPDATFIVRCDYDSVVVKVFNVNTFELMQS